MTAPVSGNLSPPPKPSTFQPLGTLVLTSSFSPFTDVPPDTVRVAAVLSLSPATPPLI